jgi:hypothetical protein
MILSVLIILTSIVLCQQIIHNSTINQINKVDSAELNHIRYGLLSIDTWKTQVSGIVLAEVDKLDFTNEYEHKLKGSIETQLDILITKVNERIKQSNKGSFKGAIKQAFIDIFISIDDIKKGIPTYADAMIKEMKKTRNQAKIKALLKEKLVHYIDTTFDQQDMSQVQRIMKRTDSLDIETARLVLANEIMQKKEVISNESIILIFISIILFLIPAFNTKEQLQPFQYSMMILSLITLLVVGVTSPMIDMEAKISKMTFILMDHQIYFENQVLYFQTKSVLDVFWIMITHKTFQMKFVGILMVLFSVVFPVLKIISSWAFYYNYRQARENKWIKFFVFKSGKWSMADVMVVAIFMAYIGFNGIITSQFGKLSTTTKDIVILTTNGTALQPGYYLFFTYAMLALFLSTYLAKLPHEEK